MQPHVQLVIARFAEDLDWLCRPPWSTWSSGCIIYNKGKPDIPAEHLPPDAVVVALPNVGRDMHTFFTHVLSGTLADITVFLPGSLMDPIKSTISTPVLAALPAVEAYKPHDIVSHFGADFAIVFYTTFNAKNRLANSAVSLTPAEPRPFGKWFARIRRKYNLEHTGPTGVCGIMAVTAESVRQRPRALYEDLVRQLAAGGPNSECGHYVERIQHMLFRPTGPPKVIWIFWHQGWSQAPLVVQAVAYSWRAHNPGWEVKCIDGTHPLVASCKWNAAMKLVAVSDVLRLQLLTTYGGVWADATMACLKPLDSWLPTLDLANSPSGMWMYRGRTPWRTSEVRDNPACWFMIARPCTYIFTRWLAQARAFWETHDDHQQSYEYYWMDQVFMKAVDSNKTFRELWLTMTPNINAHNGGLGAGDFHGSIRKRLRGSAPYAIKLSHKTPEHTTEMLGIIHDHLPKTKNTTVVAGCVIGVTVLLVALFIALVTTERRQMN